MPTAAYTRLATGSFEADAEAGLSSASFSLAGNIAGGDARGGLEGAAKRAVLAIMHRRRVSFDEARRIYMEQRLQQNGIAADGRPLDPKAVFFS